MTKEELEKQDIRLNKLCFDYQEKEKRIADLEQKLKIAREIIALGLRVCETSSIEYMNLYQKQAEQFLQEETK